MRSIIRQILAFSLIAVYGGVSLLGYGLHSLVPHHDHHHGLEVGCTSRNHEPAHSHCQHHHHHDKCGSPQCDQDHAPLVASADYCADSHQCEICAFLFQSCSEQPQLVAAVIWQHVVAAAPTALQRPYSPTSLGPHSPRGPPQHVS